jgi:hypothetical protein
MYHDALCQGRIIYKINYKYFYGTIIKNIAMSSKKVHTKGGALRHRQSHNKMIL